VGADAVDGWSGIAAFVENGDLILPRPENAATYNSGYQRFREIYTNLKPLYRE
jgi:xylulokinase